MFSYDDFKVRKTFKNRYYAYSPKYWESKNSSQLEKGDKIILPGSALNKLLLLNVEFPMMFKIRNVDEDKCVETHCSVLEFTADEGKVYLPQWLIKNLGIDGNGFSLVELELATLKKGVFVQFQAHETKFTLLDNPKLSLEQTLSKYSCLTLGDTISVTTDGYTHKLDVKELRSYYGNETAVNIIDTDIKVDFIEPKDLNEFENQQKLNKKYIYDKDNEHQEEFKDDTWSIDPRINYKNKYLNSLDVKKSTNKQYKSKFMPTKGRGTPLGTQKDKKVMNNKGSNKRKEEIVGKYRYIYEIDALGNRKCIRKLPIRSNMAFKGIGYSLKN